MELTRTIRLPERLDESSLARLERELSDDGAPVWVLRGSADVFCRGMDLASAASSDAAAGARRYAGVLRALANAPRPTIAVVEGEALGGGVGIAAACDRVIADRTAVFGLPESLFGLVPAMVVPVLLERMPPQALRLFALSGATHAAEWAFEQGLVDDLADTRDLDLLATVRAKALGRAHPASVAALRGWIPRARTMPRDEAIDEGAELLVRRLEDPRTRRALAAFIEEGVAPWAR